MAVKWVFSTPAEAIEVVCTLKCAADFDVVRSHHNTVVAHMNQPDGVAKRFLIMDSTKCDDLFAQHTPDTAVVVDLASYGEILQRGAYTLQDHVIPHPDYFPQCNKIDWEPSSLGSQDSAGALRFSWAWKSPNAEMIEFPIDGIKDLCLAINDMHGFEANGLTEDELDLLWYIGVRRVLFHLAIHRLEMVQVDYRMFECHGEPHRTNMWSPATHHKHPDAPTIEAFFGACTLLPLELAVMLPRRVSLYNTLHLGS